MDVVDFAGRVNSGGRHQPAAIGRIEGIADQLRMHSRLLLGIDSEAMIISGWIIPVTFLIYFRLQFEAGITAANGVVPWLVFLAAAVRRELKNFKEECNSGTACIRVGLLG